MTLTDVLYIPRLPCNIVGLTPDIGDITDLSSKGNGYISDREALNTAFWTPRGTAGVIELSDEKPNFSAIGYLPGIHERFLTWAPYEYQRWRAQKAVTQPADLPPECPPPYSNAPGPLVSPTIGRIGHRTDRTDRTERTERTPSIKTKPYTPAERLWLITHFISEDRFLRQYGLSPEIGRHRAEGRAAARAIIATKLAEAQQAKKTVAPGPTVVCKFSDREIQYVNKNWGSVCAFMRTLRLELGIDEHWKIAKGIADTMSLAEGAMGKVGGDLNENLGQKVDEATWWLLKNY